VVIVSEKTFIISGFKGKFFGCEFFPSSELLARLIYPDHSHQKIFEARLHEWGGVEDLGSQLLLQAHSNWKIENLSDSRKFEPLLKKMDLDFSQVSHTLALVDYLEYFFLPKPNYDRWGRLLPSLIKVLNRGAVDTDLIKMLEPMAGRKDYLIEQFPEYKTALLFWDDIVRRAISCFESDFLRIVNQDVVGFADIARLKKKNYKTSPENKLIEFNKIYRCQYCHRWFEYSVRGNSNPRSKCENCFREWERIRRRN
jgi:hypothetical protein